MVIIVIIVIAAALLPDETTPFGADEVVPVASYTISLIVLVWAIFVRAYEIRTIGRASKASRASRASSRQAWINEVRQIVADLLSGIPETSRSHEPHPKTISEHKFRKLEIHLNPSEKIHRALLYAISFAYDANWVNDEEVEKNLCLRKAGDWYDGAQRKSGISRLAQILLKLEWEKTKKLR